ncbi:MAG: DUF423 domain-containing protein [Pseudomonadota bacterium]
MILFLSAVSGFLAVALGAFGAHALSSGFDEKQVGWWETATLYLLVHAALAAGLSAADNERFWIPSAFLLGGALLFSATLFSMAAGAPRWFGAITPLGGLGMLAGWGLVAWSATRA